MQLLKHWLSYAVKFGYLENADLADADTDSADVTNVADSADSTYSPDLADSTHSADLTDSADSADSTDSADSADLADSYFNQHLNRLDYF